MTTSRAFWDAIARAKHALTVTPPDDTEIDCKACQGTGRWPTDPDGAPCIYCDGTGVW